MSGLAETLGRRIATGGPLSLAEYMAAALGDPEHGYYRRADPLGADPLGADGDFITAPEISQMFGELIGAWLAVGWQQMGAPETVRLVELGPGRGTLAADALRAIQLVPEFGAAIRLHLVETSPVFRARQTAALAQIPLAAPPEWHDRFDQIPDGPLLLVANEFFDALPIRQFERAATGWHERLIAMGEGGGFAWTLAAEATPEEAIPAAMRNAPRRAIAEICLAGETLAAEIGGRLAATGGIALIVDYGPARSAVGDSLQAVKGHRAHDVLRDPGSADITAHVDFAALAAAAKSAGARSFGPITQGAFLRRLGIDQRASALARGGSAAAEIESARKRLIDPDQMGDLFKALAVTAPNLATPAGFEDES